MAELKKHITKKRVIWSCAALAMVLAVPVYQTVTAKEVETRYSLTAAAKGTVTTSVSGTGQVSAEQTIDLKSKASGDVNAILVKNGDKVQKDQTLVEVDRGDAVKAVRDANQSVRDAEISLESAQVSYEKLLKTDDNSSAVLSAQNALNQAKRDLADLKEGPDALSIKKAENSVKNAEQDTKVGADGVPTVVRNAYDKTVTSLKNQIATLKDALADSDDILGIDSTPANSNFEYLFSVLDEGKKIEAKNTYVLAKTKIDAAEEAVEDLEIKGEDPENIDAAIDFVEDAVDAAITLLENMEAGLDQSLTSSSFSQSNLDAYVSMIESDVTGVTNIYSTLTSQRQSIEDAEETYERAQLTLDEARASLEELKEGPDPDDIAAAEERVAERELALEDARGENTDPIEIKSALNTIEQRKSSLDSAKNKLADAQEDLEDYSIRAPFDGVVAEVKILPTDELSNGTVVMTLITDKMVAEIPLNEVDVASVEVGQKTLLSFDAVTDLALTGEVAEVSVLGEASQGVVNYTVKIIFDTQDERIRSGMSMSATIITESKVDVLTVPNAAVKSGNGGSYVEVFDDLEAGALTLTSADKKPRQQPVEIGLASDSLTEITSGLTEGDRVVTSSVTTGGEQATTASRTTTGGTQRGNASFSSFGGGGGAVIRTMPF